MSQPNSSATAALFERYRRSSLSTKILAWMLVGVVAGLALGEDAQLVRPVGDLFMRLLLMSAIPLVFFNLISGISGAKDANSLGRLGARTLLYYIVTTTTALVIGLVVAYLIQPGAGMQLASAVSGTVAGIPAISDILLDMVPSNMAAAFADGKVVQVVVVAVFLGGTVILMPEPQRETLRDGFALIAGLLKKLVDIVLWFSPFGIAALVAANVGEFGGDVLGPVALFVATVWSAQVVMVLLYLLFLRLSTGRSVGRWLRATGPLYATTAATCSSLASLVVSMQVARDRVRLSENVYSFTLPLGTQLNKDGTAITLAIILMFTAQSIGIQFTTSDYVAIVLVGLVLSQGSGGIPQGGLVLGFIYLQSFNLPIELAGILAGVYRLVDMGNTTVNCMGDMVWTTVMSDKANTTSFGQSVGGS